jgi:diamine N-acetyltransferase
MAMISLRDVTIDNWRSVIELKVSEAQSKFVASNLFSLAESKFGVEYQGHWKLFPQGIYDDDTPVGFFMHGLNFGCKEYECFILRLMIDEKHQGRGYGKAAMQIMLKQFVEDERITKMGISYEPENHIAQKLYISLGFVETGEISDGELIAVYNKK